MGTVLSFAVATAVLVFGAVWFLRREARRERRHLALCARPFPEDWSAVLREKVALYRKLPESLQPALHGHIQVFLAEKNFEGCGGLEVTEPMRLIIAAQACILLLAREMDYYPRLYSILIYPSAFITNHAVDLGTGMHEEEEVLSGESWDSGALILAWDDVRRESKEMRTPHNVVLHEFAHQLDQEDGTADGTPFLEEQDDYAPWSDTLSREYEALRNSPHSHVLDEYGGLDPAEFFAVATEAFFTRPKRMQRRHNGLYAELQRYYGLDPAAW